MVGVTTDANKFKPALVGLVEELLALITDVMGKGSPVHLEEQLINRLSASETAKLNHMLTVKTGTKTATVWYQ